MRRLRQLTRDLRVSRSVGPASLLVLLLPGGKDDSYLPAVPWGAAELAMAPFGTAAQRALPGTETWRLRYTCRGWNGPAASPVADVRWALERAGRVHPGVPVVLLGHSMGGRAAVRALEHPAVCGAVLLAPWLPPGEPGTDKPVVVLQGTADVVVGTQDSRAWAHGSPSARWVPVRHGEHLLLWRARTWRQRAADAVVEVCRGLTG